MSFWVENACQLIKYLKQENLSISDYATMREMRIQDCEKEEIISRLLLRIDCTRKALKKGLASPQNSFSGLTDGSAYKLTQEKEGLISDPLIEKVLEYSLSIIEVNACGGKIVSFPTAGSCGIVPGVLWAWHDVKNASMPQMVDSFLVASLIGVLIASKTSIAGAAGGCQAECGVASAMAAAGLTYFVTKDPEIVLNSAALALKNTLGLACDPVAGLVEVPCVKRNGFLAVNSVTASHLSLCGVRSMIPFDEVIMAMHNIAVQLPDTLKESAQGGLAITPTAKNYEDKIR